MAKNRVHERCTQPRLAPTRAPGARALSGDPVIIGQIPGVMLIDATDTVANRGEGTVQLDGSFRLAVEARGREAGLAVAVGDIVYFDGDRLNVDRENGVRFGYALEVVAREATTTIHVKIGY